MRTHRLGLLVSLIPLLTLAACSGWNSVETGERGALTFTPDECGRDGCDLDDPIVVGGSTIVTLESADSRYSVVGLTLISSDPYVLDVYPVYLGSSWSEWRVDGVGPGRADLIAIDEYGYEIDYIGVDVRFADYIYLEHTRGSAVGPSFDRQGFDEVWTVNAGRDVAFDVTPMLGGRDLMGQLAYAVEIDEVLFASSDPGARLDLGHVSFNAPAGEYAVFFTAPDGMTLSVLFVVQ